MCDGILNFFERSYCDCFSNRPATPFSVRPDPSPPPLAAGPEVAAAALGSCQQQPLARLALTNLMIERGAIPSPPSETSSLTTAAFAANQPLVPGNRILSEEQIMEQNRCCVLLQLMPKNGGFLCCSGAGSAP